MKLFHLILALILLFSLIACEKKEEMKVETEQPKPSKVLDLSEVTTVMTVKEINLPERLFTLDYGDGNLIVVEAASDLEGIDKIEVGDKVEVTYLKSEAVYVTSPDADRPSIAEGRTVQVDAEGERPRKITVDIMEKTSTVEAINYETRETTLRGPDGRLTTIHVKDDVQNLENVKVGDQVVFQYTETVAVDIKKIEE